MIVFCLYTRVNLSVIVSTLKQEFFISTNLEQESPADSGHINGNSFVKYYSSLRDALTILKITITSMRALIQKYDRMAP